MFPAPQCCAGGAPRGSARGGTLERYKGSRRGPYVVTEQCSAQGRENKQECSHLPVDRLPVLSPVPSAPSIATAGLYHA